MQLEFDALLSTNTWTLVPPASNQNLVGCKWIFKTKHFSDGTIDRCKARFMAKGYNRVEGLDNYETFSLVVKPTTVRLVLFLAISSGWPLKQLDVQNAFFHGNLDENVFLSQPPGFIHPQFPHFVCKSNRALYDLKQAP